MKTLVIAEKPDMGRSIAAAIEPRAQNRRTHLEGERYVITWAIGHLVELAEPDRYDPRYKKWSLHDLPILPETFKLVPNARTRDQLKAIAELAKRCDRLVNACDAGREGQYIFSLIQRYLGLRQPVQRLWISDLTPETIRRGFAELKDEREFADLTKAARARSEADWLIGMNGTRAFTTRHRVLLSVGRVQTPVLALIYDREREIEAFRSQTYFEVAAHFAQDDTAYRGLWQGGRLESREDAERLAARTDGQPGRVAEYERKETREYPYKLYDLTLLQREANARYGFSAKKTLDLAQALYEKHKVISYPRTNSNYVNEQNIAEMHRALDALRATDYAPLVDGASRQLVHKNNKGVCNPAKVEDHHAILPTHKKAGALSPDERKVYDLIVRRFLSHFYPAAAYLVHTVITEAAGERFKTTVKEQLAPGWKVVYADAAAGKDKPKKRTGKSDGRDAGTADDADAEEVRDTPFVLDAARSVQCSRAEVIEKQTQPPKPYTEGTLLKAMESAGKQMEDEELREAMKDSGLGTPATRAATIERLKQVGYIAMSGKRIAVTQKGRTAVEVIRQAGVNLLTSPEMTGQWERRLNQIAKGTAADADFMAKVRQFAALIVDKARAQSPAAPEAFGEHAAPAGRGRRSAAGRSCKTGAGGGSRKRSAAAASQSADESNGTSAMRGAGASAAAKRTTAAGLEPIAPCPREGCGGHIVKGRKGYGCSRYKEGCRFVIWKDSFGKSLTIPMVRALIAKGATGKLKLRRDDGEPHEARIVLKDRNSGRLELER